MECSEGCRALDKLAGEVDTTTALLDARTARVEDGVANFRLFQVDVRAFITRADTRDEEHRKFQEIRDKEIKDALLVHYQKINVVNAEIGNKLTRKNLLWNIAAVCVAAAGIAITLVMGIVASYVVHHSAAAPLELLVRPDTAQVLSAHVAPQGSFEPSIR